MFAQNGKSFYNDNTYKVDGKAGYSMWRKKGDDLIKLDKAIGDFLGG